MTQNFDRIEKTSWIDRLPYPKTARAFWFRVLPIYMALLLFAATSISRFIKQHWFGGMC